MLTAWSALTVDNTKPYTITGAPRVVRGKVIIGNSGAELGVQAVERRAPLGRPTARMKPRRVASCGNIARMTAFSTASSNGTLPLTMTCVEERAGVPNRVSSFVLPLGATVNMDGTGLYQAVAAVFIAQLYGIDLSFSQQLIIVLTAAKEPLEVVLLILIVVIHHQSILHHTSFVCPSSAPVLPSFIMDDLTPEQEKVRDHFFFWLLFVCLLRKEKKDKKKKKKKKKEIQKPF